MGQVLTSPFRRRGRYRRGRKNWPGLIEAAEQLGVSYKHLWMCVSGRRESKPLLRRYAELKRQQRESTASAK